ESSFGLGSGNRQRCAIRLRGGLLDLDGEVERTEFQGSAIDHSHLGSLDQLLVDEGSVGAAEVLDVHLPIANQDAAVALADGLAGRAQVTLRVAADQELRPGDLNHLALMGSRCDDQTHLHVYFRLRVMTVLTRLGEPPASRYRMAVGEMHPSR